MKKLKIAKTWKSDAQAKFEYDVVKAVENKQDYSEKDQRIQPVHFWNTVQLQLLQAVYNWPRTEEQTRWQVWKVHGSIPTESAVNTQSAYG